MYQMTLERDLADVIAELDLQLHESPPRRSGLVEVLSNTVEVTAVVITLLQGPLTVGQWIQVLRRWRARKPATEVVTLTISAPNVRATLQVNSEAEFEDAANAIVHVAALQTKIRSRGDDDLIV